MGSPGRFVGLSGESAVVVPGAIPGDNSPSHKQTANRSSLTPQEDARLPVGVGASGVMMIPIPREGVYCDVAGVEEAAAGPGNTEVIITAKQGQKIVPLPEGKSYLGFIFARSNTPAEAEEALRRAHEKLEFELLGALPVI